MSRLSISIGFIVLVANIALGSLLGWGLDGFLLDSYDYVICGYEIAGLLVANRLSEGLNVNVLCVEAGQAYDLKTPSDNISDRNRENYEDLILFPNHVDQDYGGTYGWSLVMVPQSQLDGLARPMAQGKVLGGGSISNNMAWNRGGQDDYDAWNLLGNPG